MKNVLKGIAAALVSLFLLFALFSVWFLYEVEWKMTEPGNISK